MTSVSEIFSIETTNIDNFRCALTHPSYTKEKDLPDIQNYERLEFLGDAVLKLSISDILYNMYPDLAEGELSRIRSIVVSDKTLAQICKSIGLHNLIIMSKHEEKQGCRNIDSICACAFEAVLGAYYLDGKYEKLLNFINETFKTYITDAKEHFVKYNAKAVLQEYTQSINNKTPEYKVLSEKQFKNRTEFEIEVSYNDEILATEKGLSKKEAEQKCAYIACQKLGIIRDYE